MFCELLGKESRDELGAERWREVVIDLLSLARRAFSPDEIVIGGGLVEELGDFPPDVRRGDNSRAFRGGCRLWESHDLKEGEQASRWLLA